MEFDIIEVLCSPVNLVLMTFIGHVGTVMYGV